MGGAIEQRGRYFSITEDHGQLPKSEFRGDDHRAPLIELVDQIDQDLSARLSEGQLTLFVLDDEVDVHQIFGQLSTSLKRGVAEPRCLWKILDLVFRFDTLSAEADNYLCTGPES